MKMKRFLALLLAVTLMLGTLPISAFAEPGESHAATATDLFPAPEKGHPEETVPEGRQPAPTEPASEQQAPTEPAAEQPAPAEPAAEQPVPAKPAEKKSRAATKTDLP